LVEDDVQKWHKVEDEGCVDGPQKLVDDSLDLVGAGSFSERDTGALVGNNKAVVSVQHFVEDTGGITTDSL
jgi:hypothetical protein